MNNEYINSRYNLNIYINNPKNESNIKILTNKKIDNNLPFFSIIIPIYNQEKIIIDNLISIFNNTTEKTYEIILIIDACSDNTENILIDYFNDYDFTNNKLLTNLLILKSEIPLFETSADNLGFFCSSGKYCLEIQADMTMTENGYNMKLLKPFLLDNNIIGMSGRCCHSFFNHNGIGKLGLDIEKSLNEINNIDKKCYYIYDTCNRGPLLLDKTKLQELGYLDELNYYLDNSDHDLFLRAKLQKNWICGYVPIEFSAPLVNGSTRKPRDKINDYYYNLKKQSTKNGVDGFLKNNIYKLNRNNIIQKYILP